MEPDEIRAEIERRKKRAKELKIREILWSLYSNRVRYEGLIRQDPQWIYPEASVSLKISDNSAEFTIGQRVYQLIYNEGPPSEREWELRDDEKIVPATLGLRIDNQRVFKFEISRVTRYTHDGPVWDDRLGEITRFIDGPWVLELTNLLERIRAHEKDAWDQREAPKLEAQKKRFGL